ncbi:hypothetical protein [Marinifilum sp. D737]|uniref:hypothetical protein n=1 Tax=Marinifilum sp. D737 TaxID=2969628 RepID=UPI002276538D|nr:hypothetical protein [Marinifilum sp. D737]MCY1635601.1 hypothetical protein [Marinifilum sp. D737]
MKIIKRKSASEIIIDWIFVLIGGFLVYDTINLIYAYHFTGMLFYIMFPMTTLVSQLILGLFFLRAGVNSIMDGKKQFYLKKITGLMLLFYPINIVLLELFRSGKTYGYLLYFALIPLGLLIYGLAQKAENYKREKENQFVIADWKMVFGVIFIYLLIDLIFYKWSYLDRIL